MSITFACKSQSHLSRAAVALACNRWCGVDENYGSSSAPHGGEEDEEE